MGRKHKSFSKEDGKSGEVKELKSKIRRLASDKQKLIAELKTLQEAFDKTRSFIDNKLDGVPVEKVLKALKQENKLKKIDKDAKEVHEDKCKDCQRPYKILATSLVRTIYFCEVCKKREVIYDSAGVEEVINGLE